MLKTMIEDAETNEYKKHLSTMRKERNEAYKSAVMASSSLQLALKKLNGEVDQDINWKDMKAFPKDVWVDVLPGIRAVKIYEDIDTLQFFVVMEAGTGFKWHKNDECEESIYVLDGDLYEVETDETFTKGEHLIYEIGEARTQTTINGNKIRVTFRRYD